MTDSSWWLYVIETEKQQLYTGITTDIERRFSEHLAMHEGMPKAKARKGAKFFRTAKPVSVIYKESFSTRAEASKAETAMKKLSARAKREKVSVIS